MQDAVAASSYQGTVVGAVEAGLDAGDAAGSEEGHGRRPVVRGMVA
ncbi:protein of unknown function [Pseudomonas sp. JV551A1]|uniref:Uncharacterized protein n=1 Tax=Pseudomonas inefficax TaxID=2078786 RepID=A0AAQ1PBK6_9PSED|nr:protein of unknown function [Pseudomonas sp. JV551A1]SPO61219.1 protein of unknown function [Pseudomonas inefficax]